ncbi:hypothetical protein OM076_38860 [Solirubrobacter ginsenosidimutans]|uniref:Uncharacterized protein n=1 Tax=Solirubrobacter ginsenosidimutans TaxID=490573 RepID=A0A9X3S7R2_9ACTN|nr:hypothetical protein [Solirubrobacter ginsenosidimutans]MDA0166291.1 hypothetical protein [Solirubrobacter ginsenosidimutans]
MSALESPRVGWDAQRRARALSAQRDRLRARLPHKISSARALPDDLRVLIVDDSIQFVSVGYDGTINSQRELENLFWDAATKRVARAHEGRYNTVRAGYQRADIASLDELGTDATPEDHTLVRAELSAALHFAALLEPEERDVFLCQHRDGRRRPLGAKAIARELGLPLGAVRSAERSIAGKHERFATIYAAGRLCGYLAPAVAALAEGDPEAEDAVSGRELAARVHLEIERCPTCTADYARQLRYLQGARFHHQVVVLLPAAADERSRSLTGGLREWLPDWMARLLSHEPTSGQLLTSGAGRGIGGAALAKLATVCFGAMCACVATGVFPIRSTPESPARATPTPTATPSPAAPESRLPHGAPTPTPTPAVAIQRKRTSKRSASQSKSTQGGTGPRSHEQAPASPAPSNAAPGGASEFDPSYQPNAPAAPAPVPAAPGAAEFG